jgi:hypothetical protein
VFPLDYVPFLEYEISYGENEVIKRGILSKSFTILELSPDSIYYLPSSYYVRVSEWREVCAKILPLTNNIHSAWIEETVDGINFFPVAGLSLTSPEVGKWNKIYSNDLLNYIRVAVKTLPAPNPPPTLLVVVLEVRR